MSKEISVKDAKCTALSLQSPVEFKKAVGVENEADFQIEAYTGKTVDRWWGKLAIDVNGIRAKKNIPIFRDHLRGNIVGYSTKTWKDGSFYVSGKFSKATQHATEVRELAQEGFPWQASIGVMPLKVLAIEDGAEQMVNGKKLKGPAEVWLESEVYETSFVPLGADDGTSISVFSRFEEAEQPAEQPAEKETHMGDNEKKKEPVVTAESLKADHPDIANELLAEGATAERERIQAVLAQSMPGHDDLIQKLAFDGKTTGPEAAVQVLQAEKQIRTTAAENFKADAPKPVKQPPTEDFEAKKVDDDESLPIDERAKLKWDGDKETRAEFGGDFDSFKAYFEAMQSGRARVIRGKDGK